MSNIKIDRDVLKCAINNLNLNEIQATLESCGETIDTRDKKHEVVQNILTKLDNETLSEDLYLALKTRAFSINYNFYDGFFYKYNQENIEFNHELFIKYLIEEGEKENSSKQSNITFKHKFYNKNNNEEKNIFTFTFSRESKKGVYDYKEDGVKFLHNKIQANIEIYYDNGLVYIHSKNSSESTTIKTLLQSAINRLIIDKESNKTKLSLPKFNNKIVEKWSKDNKISVNGISVISIHMLDLLCEFEKEENSFSEFSVKRIYLEDEIIDTVNENIENFKISGHIFLGENLQNAHDVFQELSKGKKLKGFELLVNYQYEDLESKKEMVAPVLIRILQDSHYIRLSLSKEATYVRESILCEIYEKLKLVFLNKVNSKNIQNTAYLIEFINKCKEVNIEKSEEMQQPVEVY